MPTSARRTAAVVLNADSGTLKHSSTASALVRQELESHGLTVDMFEARGLELRRALCDALASNSDMVLVGGGDGTVRAAANVLAGSDKPLGVLPLGTLNHFAKDLGIPMSLPAAVAALATAEERPIDLGELNGNYFINNSSLGIYPEIVELRDAERERSGRGKWSALASASYKALRELKHLNVNVSTEGGELVRRTPFVFVGNNDYELRFPALGARRRIDQGILCLYVGDRLSRRDLAGLAWRAMTGRLDEDHRVDVFRTGKVLVETDHSRVQVSLDGELVRLAPPLVYRIRRGALHVLAPPVKP